MPSPLLDHARRRLNALILESNPGSTLAVRHYEIGTVTPININNMNTSVVLTGVESNGVSGQRAVSYNRLNIGQQMALINSTLELQADAPLNSYDLLEPILQQYDITLLTEDIVLENINNINYQLKASPNSTGWVGTANITIVPITYMLSNVLPVTEINGFVYPENEPEEAVASIYVNSKQQLLTTINYYNNSTLTLNDVTISNPSVVATDSFGRNTTVTLTPIEGSSYYGDPVTIKYIRLIADTVYSERIIVEGDIDDITTTLDLLTLMQQNNNVLIQSTEIVNININKDLEEAFIFFGVNAYAWQPGTALIIELPHSNMLENLIDGPLEGFVPPVIGANLQLLTVTEYTAPYDIGVMNFEELDITQSSLDIMFELLNLNLYVTLTDINVTVEYNDDDVDVIVVDITAIENEGYSNSLQITYSRMNISDYLLTIAPLDNDRVVIPTPTMGDTFVQSVIAHLNTTYDLNLDYNDFTLNELGDDNWELIANNTELAWYGSVLMYSGT